MQAVSVVQLRVQLLLSVGADLRTPHRGSLVIGDHDPHVIPPAANPNPLSPAWWDTIQIRRDVVCTEW